MKRLACLLLMSLVSVPCALALAILPARADDDYHRCIAPSNSGNQDAVIADCSRYLQQPGHPNSERKLAYWQRGKIYQKSKQDYDLAVADYSQMIALDPKDAHSYFLRGWAYMWKSNSGKDEESCASAHADFDQANALDPQKYHFDADFYERFGCGPHKEDYTNLLRR
jgi:tetratricopeptide (TPR) repeat protein